MLSRPFPREGRPRSGDDMRDPFQGDRSPVTPLPRAIGGRGACRRVILLQYFLLSSVFCPFFTFSVFVVKRALLDMLTAFFRGHHAAKFFRLAEVDHGKAKDAAHQHVKRLLSAACAESGHKKMHLGGTAGEQHGNSQNSDRGGDAACDGGDGKRAYALRPGTLVIGTPEIQDQRGNAAHNHDRKKVGKDRRIFLRFPQAVRRYIHVRASHQFVPVAS
nr:MAG TPA: hypothetical protein [Caudoviricetes sp.]